MDFVQQAELREIVIRCVDSIGGKRRGDSVLIYCPWHRETKPSLNIHVGHSIIPGSFHCFGCQAKGNWNDLAKVFNFPRFDFRSASESQSSMPANTVIRHLLEQIKMAEAEDCAKVLKGFEELPDDFSWRGYSSKFYKRFNAQFYWDRKTGASYLYFPLHMNNQYMGYTLCNLDGKDEKYKIFAEALKVLFLYDFVPPYESVVLVEGHFDALRLWAEGITAMSVFGARNWSDVKKSYLLTKHPKKIVIAFDGDQPGCDGAVQLWKSLRPNFKHVDIFYLPCGQGSKLDPGNMPKQYVDQLRGICEAAAGGI